jgi:hypothetical protein
MAHERGVGDVVVGSNGVQGFAMVKPIEIYDRPIYPASTSGIQPLMIALKAAIALTMLFVTILLKA